MHMPHPTPEHGRLAQAMIGQWDSEETLLPSPWLPEGGKRTGHSSARAGMDGLFVVSDYVQHKDGGAGFTGHGVYGWDPEAGHYTMQWFDSMAFTGGNLVPGRWEGDTLIFERENGGRYVYRFDAPDRYVFELWSGQGGQWTLLMTSVFRRRA